MTSLNKDIKCASRQSDLNLGNVDGNVDGKPPSPRESLQEQLNKGVELQVITKRFFKTIEYKEEGEWEGEEGNFTFKKALYWVYNWVYNWVYSWIKVPLYNISNN